MKHQGAVKVAAGVVAASMIKNPWLKMICIGVAIEGAITEARLLTADKDTGISFFEQIGANETEIDREMMDAAAQVKGYGDRFDSTVAGYGDRFDSTVAGWNNRGAEQMNDNISSVTGVAGYY